MTIILKLVKTILVLCKFLQQGQTVGNVFTKRHCGHCSKTINVDNVGVPNIILLHEKFLQFDWLRAVVFQLNLKYLLVKFTNLLRVVVSTNNSMICTSYLAQIPLVIFQNYFKIVSNFTRLTAREITYNNFEISLVVFMPNITTNHAITYTNPVGFALFSYVNAFFCCNTFT